LPELLFLDDSFLEVVEFANYVDDIIVALGKNVSGGPLAMLKQVWS